jgi:hypothetical protein
MAALFLFMEEIMQIKVGEAELTTFVQAAQKKVGIKLGHETGQRYARIFICDPDYRRGDRVVFCFVDLTDGNVLRPDGWKRPNLKVKNSIQGNVFDEHKGIGTMRAGNYHLCAPAAS